jgi:hypothetical protein
VEEDGVVSGDQSSTLAYDLKENKFVNKSPVR